MSEAGKGTDGPAVSVPLDDDTLHALKVAFCYMPRLMDINEYDHPGRVERTRADVEAVREVLLLNDVDPDEVHAEINPDDAGNSSY